MIDKPLISFDYAIRFLLKDKADYDIIEAFISAILALEGYKPIKIKGLVDPETLKEDETLKRSIADLLVEDEEGTHYIVEIDRSYTSHFVHKACFNTSRLIVDSTGTGQDYTKISKIFHISLLYFHTQEMRKPLHHGKVVISEIDTAKSVEQSLEHSQAILHHTPVKLEAGEILPEYFFISVPLFDGTVAEAIDEWLYVLKHSDTRPDFKSPAMQKVAERLNILHLTKEEQLAYYKYAADTVRAEDVVLSAATKGKEEGRIEGRIEGKIEGKREVACALRTHGTDLETIAAVTGLTITEIIALTP